MKKPYAFLIIVAFVLFGAQAIASPPVAPPVEGFVIKTDTKIECEGSVMEKENYNWTYFEGVGNLNAVTFGTAIADILESNPNLPRIAKILLANLALYGGGGILQQGFQEGAEVAYQQNFTALDGVTTFEKDFWASSAANADGDNLTVDKIIKYDKNLGGSGMATHSEKVGLAVVSAGGADSPSTTNPAPGLLTLCPWTTSGNGDTNNNGNHGCGYPATNEGIAAGSSFKVSNINFTSTSKVSSTVNPALKYAIVADGEGAIAAGFVVELFEGATCWGQHAADPLVTILVKGLGYLLHYDVNCPVMVQDPVPAVASRTSYAEHATADGTWAFKKAVSYTSVMPAAGVSAATFPFNQVP